MSLPSYAYTNLTSALRDRSSPLRAYLDQRFPLTKPLQADYRATAGPLLVAGGDANPGTLGAAFDYLLRFVLDPAYVPHRPSPPRLRRGSGGRRRRSRA